MNQDKQPDALRLAGVLRENKRIFITTVANEFEAAAKELCTQHARVLELEAAQAQRAPLTDEQIAEACGWKAGLGCKPLPRELRIARAIEAAHGITQEKQG